MKTPDEIKKGLRCPAWVRNHHLPCSECDYHGREKPPCAIAVHEDAFAYIQQLEAERDAAVNDLHYLVNHPHSAGPCYACAHTDDCYSGGDCDPIENDRWEWRGVQKDEKRYAQVGDFVKIIKVTSPVKSFRVGGIYKVVQLEEEWKIPGAVILDCGGYYATPQEYEVLEGYKPDTKEE